MCSDRVIHVTAGESDHRISTLYAGLDVLTHSPRERMTNWGDARLFPS